MNRNGVGTLRKLKIFFITVVCLLASNIAFTLGVGDIKVNSGLSQPLDAEIKLFSVRPGEGDNIRVSLATLKEFDKAGIDRPLHLSSLKFKVVEKGDGNAYIKVYSKGPIREPFLDFLVDIDWPSGRLLREYTLLLDPPIFTQRKAAPVQSAVVAAPTRIIREELAPAPVVSTPLFVPTAPVVSNNETGLFPHIQIDEAPAPAVTLGATKALALESAAFSGDNYKVKKSETLWSIARSVRPDDSISVSQMMIALQQANPEAFANNNINGLKSGFVLRIPDRADIEAIGHSQALRNSLQQNELWRAAQDNLASAVTPSGTTALTTTNKTATATPKQEQASIKLITPDANAGAAAQGGGVDAGASSEKLALATEQLASKDKENDELQDRVQSLEDQIGSMERLLELKDDSLSELQNKLTTETSKPAVETAPMVEATPEPVVAEKKPEPAPVVKPIVKEEAKVNPYALAEAEAPKAKPAAAKPAETSLFDDPIILAAAIAVLLAILVLVWLMMKRRQNNMQQFPESILSSKPANVSASKPNNETTLLSDFAPSAMDGAIESDSSEVDPSAEADVYIAYGKHQQAEELLLASIEQEPDRLDLRLKLMEVYHATGNADSFLVQASHLNGAMDDQSTALWDKAVVMGRELCPGNDLFGSDVNENEDDFADLEGIADLDDDLDLNLEMDDTLTIDEPEEISMDTSDDELSLDMDMDLESLDTSDDKDDGLSLDMGDLTLDIEEDAAAEPEAALDIGELTLEIEDDTTASPTEEASFDLGDEIELDVDDMLEDVDSDEDDDGILGMDEVATKLDLAKAYIDMGDPDGARAILDEVLTEGNDDQQSEAKGLIEQL
ncbi:MAG: FimV family protein [Sulfuriflexus sp.]|nr:FimV family protein [Sulfuriflexus sp.]